MSSLEKQVDLLSSELPDPEGARLFYVALTAEHPKALNLFKRDQGMLSDALALAAWSPFLATTLLQHPDYLGWLARERTHQGVVSREQFMEALGRFALTNSQLDLQVVLARFRRRELLRTYLRDIRGASTIVEITEELSNLADAVLSYVLDVARQDLDNLYGAPEFVDMRGRRAIAGFSILGLGKLGSFELNYASDIDLLYLYSNDGNTTGKGARGHLTNREYFVKLGESVTSIIGRPGGEGAPYRVDLRLRPYGREGVLASSIEEAVKYYQEKAEAWERQAFIRLHASAGSNVLYARFGGRVRHSIYRTGESVENALAAVKRAKTEIDRHHSRDHGGFNVKLGRGGIREIEFIVQALQLAFGGRDPWLREPHTLISLGRLADRQLITERERAELSDAYKFLRTIEHRLQMEEGLQTHSVPESPERRALLARRMHFRGPGAPSSFDQALAGCTHRVRSAYDRVFGESAGVSSAQPITKTSTQPETRAQEIIDPEEAAATYVASTLCRHLEEATWPVTASPVEHIASVLLRAARKTPNPRNALTLAGRVAASLEKSGLLVRISEPGVESLVHLCGASEFLGEMLAANPSLTAILSSSHRRRAARNYLCDLRSVIEAEETYREELAALRKTWARFLIEIATLDVTGAISMKEANARLTALAAASIDAASVIAKRELVRKFGELDSEPRLSVLGLGRLGGAGMDYGSDLDVVMIFDDKASCPVSRLTHSEFYGRLVELMAAALSSMTRDGYLYRVDLRLRPDGGKGPTCSSAQAFAAYLRERSVEWEWLAYVKIRAAAGNMELGRRVEEQARRIIHERGQATSPSVLCAETRRVRERLENERTTPGRGLVDFKYQSGGMLDVYFATRYLQLRDNVPDQGEDRSTLATIERLHTAGSLADAEFAAMKEGYGFLRRLDHHVRLALGRSTRLPRAGHHAFKSLIAATGCTSEEELKERLIEHMTAIRKAYDRITACAVNLIQNPEP